MYTFANKEIFSDIFEKRNKTFSIHNLKMYKPITQRKSTNLGTLGEIRFRNYSHLHGYKNKVAGDNAYANKKGKIVRLIKVHPSLKLTVYHEGRGRRDID